MSTYRTTERFIIDARKVHGSTYDYSGVRYTINCEKVRIVCPCHGDFLQRPSGHLRGKGCPSCGFERTALAKRKSGDDFLKMAQKIHGSVYDYSTTKYVSAREKVEIVCIIHGGFWVTPDNHISKKSGCPICANKRCGELVSLRLKGTHHNNFAGSLSRRTRSFINRAKKIHNDRYDYSLVSYKSNKKDVVLVCKKHGKFNIQPGGHLRGGGCPVCAREKRRTSQEEFISRSIDIHGKKYDYSRVSYFNNITKVIIGCPIHGEFLQAPVKHLSGNGCLRCKESHGEKAVAAWLDLHGIAYEREKIIDGCANIVTGKMLRFDFYIPEKNMCVEFDGEQHSVAKISGIFKGSLDKIRARDRIKDEFCKTHRIKLIRIPYTDFNRIGDILEQKVG